MANARITYNFDAWKEASITVSSEISAANFSPKKNVLDPRPGAFWGTTGDSSEWIRFDLGSAQTITCFYLNAHNLTANATVVLQANIADSWASPAEQQQLTIATDSDGNALPSLCYFPNWSAYRYWRVTFADAANPEGRIRVGNIFAGQYYELGRNWSDGARITWMDPSLVTQIPGTVELVKKEDISKRFRQIRVDFSVVTRAEKKKWETIFRKIGNHAPCILSLDPTEEPSWESAYCYLLTDMDLAWQMVDQFDVLTMVFEEKTR